MTNACTTDPDSMPALAHDGYLELHLSRTEATRADLNQAGAGTFSDGDRVGLYIDNGSDITYRTITLQHGEWLPRLSRRELGSGELILAAHYPALESPDTDPQTYVFGLAADQRGDGRATSDLLVSQVVVEAGSNRAELPFRHALHRLQIELTGATDHTELSVRSPLTGQVNLLTGEARATEEASQSITPYQNADGRFEVVIFPQAAAPYRTEGNALLQVRVADQTYEFPAPERLSDGTALTDFEPGKQVSIRLTLKENEVSPWANQKRWVYGITPPDEGSWVQLFPNLYPTYYLAWKAEYGWYDCNKQNPSARPNGIPDGMMCWAATASNLLHWWIAQNQPYIDLFGERYQGPDYTYPLPKPQESDIFQCFIDSFADEAGYGDEGVNWFIHGIKPSGPAMDYPYNPGGYFKEVFPEGVKLGSNVGGLGKEVFNNTIKEALANKKAIGLSIGSVRSGHVVTMWGAEFDENGDVSHIYVADNNDRNQFEIWKVGCTRFEVAYLKYPEGATYTCYKAEDGSPITINRLVLLELGDKYWEQYLGLQDLQETYK